MGTFKTLLETGTDMLRSFNGTEPQVADSAYVDETAVVIGDVVIEDEASVWPNTTLRGDHGTIVVGEGANVQDNAVLHETAELEPYSTVGHSAIVHDATVAERALVGMNAVVLDGAHVGEGAVVAAGSVVTEDTEIPSSTLVAGAPAEPKTEIDDPGLEATADRYVELSKEHAETSHRLD
ncbi:gamma carbonic anhydrase family protein [Natrinema sp. H-ect4]|jgi:carbonic anhydrase/acetyltransferase-like protein (isoleucine patch superfamily)|uniref:gamma carbonic anhydrase family protein n=1 Tax=Natrinema sp. H-ect4 TaxID=3242699 RepID=UPI0035A946C6